MNLPRPFMIQSLCVAWSIGAGCFYYVAASLSAVLGFQRTYALTYALSGLCVLLAFAGTVTLRPPIRLVWSRARAEAELLVTVLAVWMLGVFMQPASNMDLHSVPLSLIEIRFVFPLTLACCTLLGVLDAIRNRTGKLN